MDNLSASQEKAALPPDIVPIVEGGAPGGEEGTTTASGMSPPTSPNRRSLKRSSSGELAGGDNNNTESSKRRELPASSAAAAGHAAPYRALRKQVSSPVLTQGKGGATPAFTQQEPWKREINDLWAKQLAMMREINTLKVELGRREAARQREILAMRQELDVMRAEIFRLRQVHGVGPLPSLSSSGGGGKEVGKDSASEEGDAAPTTVDEDVGEPEKGTEEAASEMETSLQEEDVDKAPAGSQDASESN